MVCEELPLFPFPSFMFLLPSFSRCLCPSLPVIAQLRCQTQSKGSWPDNSSESTPRRRRRSLRLTANPRLWETLLRPFNTKCCAREPMGTESLPIANQTAAGQKEVDRNDAPSPVMMLAQDPYNLPATIITGKSSPCTNSLQPLRGMAR